MPMMGGMGPPSGVPMMPPMLGGMGPPGGIPMMPQIGGGTLGGMMPPAIFDMIASLAKRKEAKPSAQSRLRDAIDELEDIGEEDERLAPIIARAIDVLTTNDNRPHGSSRLASPASKRP